MNIKHKKTSKRKSFKDVLGRIWISCRHCKNMRKCYPKCDKSKIDGFCRKGKLRKD